MEITMARGDLETREFQVMTYNNQGQQVPFTDTMDEIYMTVKRDFHDKDYKFQKRLSSETILSLGEGKYQFTIDPEDTDGLPFGTYDFDIECVIYGALKKTFMGKLNLTGESTYASNEVIV